MILKLEEPEVGGFTPFFQAGIAARAVKGSVVVWFNFYRNGTIRKDVYHGACPVIHGSKISTFIIFSCTKLSSYIDS